MRAPSVHRRRWVWSASRHTTAAPIAATPSGPTIHPTNELPAALPAMPDGDAQRREPDRLLALGPRDVPDDVGGLLRHEDPQQAVGEHPGPADAREHDERGPHPQHRHAEVLGDPAGHARHEAAAAQAHQWFEWSLWSRRPS